MSGLETEVTALCLAKGLADIHERVVNDGLPVRQDAGMPSSARRGLSLLSRECLRAGPSHADLGASVHDFMALASEPFRAWGLPAFAGDFRFADVVLVDPDTGAPTDDCREMARAGGGVEVAALEELHHERLQAAIKDLPKRQAARAYTAIRELCVRNPVIREDALHTRIVEGGHVAAARTIMEFYRPIPLGALFGEVAHRCAHCRSLLWPDRDRTAYPHGRCLIRQCRLAHPDARLGDVLDEPHRWRLATTAILGFWVGPGLDEIQIYDALNEAGRIVALYPFSDAADVGVDGLDVGIDVKTYASPVLLGGRLTRSTGRLSMFGRRIIAIPDDKLRQNPRYVEQLRGSYGGSLPLEFLTVSAVLREFGA